ncbi:MAG: FkbM family methyltransferase [Methylobacterium sp.]
MLERIRQAFGEGGAGGVLNRTAGFGYRRGLRPFLPKGPPARLGGVLTCYDVKASDRLVPTSWLPWWMSDPTGCPSYEGALVSGLAEHVRPGDRVVVVGGGIGVTAVNAALHAGPSGHVECFEGSARNCGFVRETAALNGVANLIVRHAVVGSSIAVYGEASEIGTVVSPGQLPRCDVLELDCEGAELRILREMTIRPQVLLVETHGLYQSPASLVASIMESCGYTVSDRGWAEPHRPAECARNDIRVLQGFLAPSA